MAAAALFVISTETTGQPRVAASHAFAPDIVGSTAGPKETGLPLTCMLSW